MGSQRGFTILEVTLFLAISGMLLLVAVTGVNGSIRTNRMADTTKSLESYIETQISEVRSGVMKQQVDASNKLSCPTQSKPIATPQFPGSSDVCIVMGRLLVFTTGAGSSVKVYNITGELTPNTTCQATAANNIERLRQYCPKVVETSTVSDRYVPEWSSTILATSGFLKNGFKQQLDRVAILRDPTSESVYVISYDDIANMPLTGVYSLPASYVVPENVNQKGVICLDGGGFPALKSYVLFGGGEGVGSIKSAADAAVPAELGTC